MSAGAPGVGLQCQQELQESDCSVSRSSRSRTAVSAGRSCKRGESRANYLTQLYPSFKSYLQGSPYGKQNKPSDRRRAVVLPASRPAVNHCRPSVSPAPAENYFLLLLLTPIISCNLAFFFRLQQNKTVSVSHSNSILIEN